ncbi:MAG: hypothetical protein ACRDGB_11025 [Candidatus Limnocylindria bacterium]
MRLEHRSVPQRVLDRHHQADRPLVLGRQCLALCVGPAVLGLKVGQHSLDFGCDDLLRTKEDRIDRLAMLANQELQRWMQRRMRPLAEPLSVAELASVPQRRRATLIRPQDKVEPDRFGYGTRDTH